MSMMGRFVQVSPDRLKEILDDPSGVEELFASEPVSQAMPKLMGALQGQLQRQTPQMLAASMAAMPPQVRERLAQSLKNVGIDPDALARGEGGDALAKLMAQRLQELKAHFPGQSPAPSGSARPSGKDASISLDKAWHGVHYLLCGEIEPGSAIPSHAVMGGVEVGEDLGYGPARYFEADEVRAISQALSGANLESEMIARFDPARMTNLGIYPGGWKAGDDNWLMEEFRRLRKFYDDASAAKLAIVTNLE